MSVFAKDAVFGGWTPGTPAASDFFAILPMGPALGVVLTRQNGTLQYSDVVVPMTSFLKYVEPASGVEGGWKQVAAVP